MSGLPLPIGSDAQQIAATVYGGQIWTSTNGGFAWSTTGSPSLLLAWNFIASSADFTALIAAVTKWLCLYQFEWFLGRTN